MLFTSIMNPYVLSYIHGCKNQIMKAMCAQVFFVLLKVKEGK